MKRGLQSVSRAITAFEIGLLKTQRLFMRHPRAVLIGTIVTTLVLAAGIPRMKFVLSPEDLTESVFESSKRLKEVRETFKDGYPSTLVLTPPAGREKFTSEETCRIWQWFSEERNQHPTLQSSQSTFDVLRPKSTAPGKLTYEPVLAPDCQTFVSEAALDSAFRSFREGPWIFLKSGKNSTEIVLQLTFSPSEDKKFGDFSPKVLSGWRERAATELPSLVPGIGRRWIGDADYQWYVREGFDRSRLMNPIMVGLLIVVLGFVFGNWRAGLIYSGSLVLSGIWIYGLKGWFGSPFDALSLNLFLVLGVATLEDFIFISQEQRKGHSVAASLRRVAIPGFHTTWTTMLGFLSLTVSKLPMIDSMGTWSAVGGLLEWAMLFLVAGPLWNRHMKKKVWVSRPVASPVRKGISDRLEKLLAWRMPYRFALLSLLIFPAAIYATKNMEVQDSPEILFLKSHPYRQDLNFIQESRGWKGYVHLVFPESPEEEFVESTIERLRATEAGRLIAEVESPARVEKFLTQGLSDDLRTAVLRDFRRSKAYERYESEESWRNPASTRATLFIREIDLRSVLAIQSAIRGICDSPEGPRCFGSSSLFSFAEFSDEVSTTLFESLFGGMFSVGALILLLSIHRRRTHLFPWIISGCFWGPAFVLLVLYLWGIPINFMSCIFLSTLMGLTGDNAVHYLYGTRPGRPLTDAIEDHGTASLQTGLIMAGASLVLLGAYFGPSKMLGALMCMGLLASLLGEMWILGGLVASADEKRERLSRDSSAAGVK